MFNLRGRYSFIKSKINWLKILDTGLKKTDLQSAQD